jgi:serine/threonine protein kinase
LGVGTYSYVKHGVDKLSGDHFAIKISRRANAREMLKNEFNILKTIKNRNVVKVFDFIDNDIRDESYLVMEYFNGKSILELVEENTSFSESETKQIVYQITEVISQLHSEGIAHRDIKPENILVNDEKEVKVIDFNVSKVTLNADSSSDEPNKKFKSFYITQISSPLYAPPELKKG